MQSSVLHSSVMCSMMLHALPDAGRRDPRRGLALPSHSAALGLDMCGSETNSSRTCASIRFMMASMELLVQELHQHRLCCPVCLVCHDSPLCPGRF